MSELLFAKEQDKQQLVGILVNSLFESAVYDIQYQALQLLFGIPNKFFEEIVRRYHSKCWPSRSALVELRQKGTNFDKLARLLLNDVNETLCSG